MSAAMIPPSDPLHPPLAVAALASAWPRLRVLADREAAVLDALTTLQRVAGDVPQADVIEPFDPEAGEPWELRCDLPDLSADTWQALRDALRHHEHELSPGAPPEVTRADDLGVRLCDWLDGDGLSARMIVGTADGEQSLDLRRSSRADADIEVLERQLAEALHEAHPSLRLTSDRGHDTVTPVVHRTSGRLGLELYIGPEVWQGLNGDEVLALRRTAVDALASVVHERRLHPTLQLAPDVLWGTRLGGMVLLVWIVAAHVGALPGDEPVASGLSPHPVALGRLLATEGLFHDLEVQVIGTDHDATTEAVRAAGGERWRGGLPRWVRHEQAWHFCPTWRAPADVHTASVVDRLGGTARLVPGLLVGLEEEDAWLLRAHVWGTHAVALRVRDAVRDRDVVPAVQERPPASADPALMAPVFQALGAERVAALQPHEGLPVRPVQQGDRRGLLLSFAAEVVPGAHEVLRALTGLEQAAPWVDWSLPRSGALQAVVWHPGGSSPRVWR